MITISVLGLDQYAVGHYSKIHTKNLASLFETSEDNISFYAPNSYVFHNGVEQTSWNTIVRIHAPHKYECFESKVAKYILNTLKEFTINLSIEFYYYEESHHYSYLNKEYPHFITDDNIVDVEEDELAEGEELCEENMFEGFEEKLEEAAHNHEEHHCCCGGNHHCHDKDEHKN